MERFLLQTLTQTLMPTHSTAILLLYPTHPTILNPHISYHTILIISHLPLYIIFLIKVALKEQDLMFFQVGFSNFFSPRSVSPVDHLQQLHQAGIFPAQWKSRIIHVIKKINSPTQPNQYRHISITPILSLILEKYIVKDHIYRCLTNAFIKSSFDNQFAFRPTGSPTSAIIYLTFVITSLLTSNKFFTSYCFKFF